MTSRSDGTTGNVAERRRAGWDAGGHEPSRETALSILAEMTAVRYGGNAAAGKHEAGG